MNSISKVGVRALPSLWRQREDSAEERTEFDSGYEQASDECAAALERALAQQLASVAPVEVDFNPRTSVGLNNVCAKMHHKDGTGASDALYELAVRHGALESAAAGFAHTVNNALIALYESALAQQPAAVDGPALLTNEDRKWLDLIRKELFWGLDRAAGAQARANKAARIDAFDKVVALAFPQQGGES